jgi:HAD superfamily hydrolase (TIGR01458 family)
VEQISGLLIDIDGVLTVSWRPLRGASAALAALRRRNLPIRLVTNTTSRTRSEVARLLGEAGIGVDRSEILTAPVATAAYLRRHHPGARCLLVNEGDLDEDLQGVEMVEDGPFDVVLVGGAGPAFSYEAINRAFEALTEGAELVAMHRNLSWRTSDGLQLDSGGFVTGLEQATGVEATVVGKPAPAFFASAVDELGIAPELVAMVGDDVINDVLAAQACGLTGILVRTGKFRPETLHGLDDGPDFVLASFADVPRWLDRIG